MATILLGGHLFNYQIERKSIVSIRLRIKSPNSFVISCHHLTPGFIITKFVNDHQQWIIKNTKKITTKKTIKDIKSLLILGEDYEFIVKKMPRDSVVILREEHKIYANTTSLSVPHLKKIVDHKFRPLALSLIKKELAHLSQLHGFEYGRVSVRNTTTRFGSCSYHGNLSFNWQIILFPRPIFVHILLHELNHLRIKDHSKKFWDQLTIYDPDTKSHNLWLKKEGSRHFIV